MPLRFRLHDLLRTAHLSQADLADRIGIDRAIISRICTNQTRRISLRTVSLICSALGVYPNDLFETVADGGEQTERTERS